MAQYNGPQVTRETTHAELLELFAMLVKDLQFILNGHLNANNIQANSIETKNFKAGVVTTDVLAAGSVTADKITVAMLSAIAADLGTITAGVMSAIEIFGSVITGSLIQTDEAGNYPRSVMSVIDNLFAAYASAGNYIAMTALTLGSPALTFYEGDDLKALLYYSALTGLELYSLSGKPFTITSDDDIVFSPGAGKKVKVLTWDTIQKTSSPSQTLQQALDSKANKSSFTGSIPPGSTILVSDGVITGYV